MITIINKEGKIFLIEKSVYCHDLPPKPPGLKVPDGCFVPPKIINPKRKEKGANRPPGTQQDCTP